MIPISVAPRGVYEEFRAEEIEQSIPDRFERQVDRFPDRIAVKAGETLTYAELDDRANRVAAAIVDRRGEGAEPVGLLFEQGAAAIAAILGALKAGKFYVPLDPAHPKARLDRMLAWVGAELVVTDSAHADVLSNGSDPLLVDCIGHAGNDRRPNLATPPDAVAYVFFTSGSTGEPKAVFDSHRNVLHNIRRYTNALTIGRDDRLTLLQSCAFSGSVSSLFAALLNGATVFPFNVSVEGPGRLADLLVRERLTMYHSVPAIFRSFLIGGGRFPDLRVIRLEGDRASHLDVDLFRRHFDPACILANGLGTTETGLCRQLLIDSDAEVGDGILPVGYPVADMELALLDDDGAPAEPGEPGEIAVRSRYLALGYWGRRDLTDAAFLPDPEGGDERIYLTGDMGRLREDGCLDYLARKDFQLKVRGHRIDVADVESALIALDDVRDAVVTTRENTRGEAELVAYVVGTDERRLRAGELRAALAEALPPELIPTRFVTLAALPLNEFGKVDRRALAAPSEIAREQVGRGPRNPLEQRLVEIWEEVLETAPIGVDEGILDLGGDSLSAAVIAARLESELGWLVTPTDLWEYSTVANLVEELSGTKPRSSPLTAINPGGHLPPLFLVHDLMGDVARYSDLARHLGDDQPVWGLRETTGATSIELTATRYLDEIRSIQPAGPYRIGGWCYGAVVAFEMAHQLEAAGEHVDLLALMGISAFDFPQLVAPAARRRYQANNGVGFRARARSHLSAAGDMSALERAAYLGGSIARLATRPLRRRPRPDPVAAVGLARRNLAFGQYVARPYPGRALLILSAEETAAYSTDPASDWRRLATAGVDVLELPAGHREILAEPHAREVASHLRELLQQPAEP